MLQRVAVLGFSFLQAAVHRWVTTVRMLRGNVHRGETFPFLGLDGSWKWRFWSRSTG